MQSQYRDTPGNLCVAIIGSLSSMSASKNVSTLSRAPPLHRQRGHPKPNYQFTSDAYQKVLDYHVAEILLSTIVLAVIALLRLHH